MRKVRQSESSSLATKSASMGEDDAAAGHGTSSTDTAASITSFSATNIVSITTTSALQLTPSPSVDRIELSHEEGLPEEDGVIQVEWYQLGLFGGAVLLLLLVLFCVVFLFLCIVLRRLRKLSQQLEQTQGAKDTGENNLDSECAAEKKKQPHSEETSPGTVLSNTENSENGPQDGNPNVEAMYAAVSEEHRMKKKMAKLRVQQYDDVNLFDGKAGGDESKMVVSVQMEGVGEEGYSRLCHAGPRMTQTKRYLHSSLSVSSPELLDDGSKPGRAGSVKTDMSYSEVEPMRPHSKVIAPRITGGYSMIEQGKEECGIPPPLPTRMMETSMSTPPVESSLLKTAMSAGELDILQEVEGSPGPVPYQNPPTTVAEATEQPRGGAGYSVITSTGSPPHITDDFFSDIFEFRNLQAQEESPEQLYEKVK